MQLAEKVVWEDPNDGKAHPRRKVTLFGPYSDGKWGYEIRFFGLPGYPDEGMIQHDTGPQFKSESDAHLAAQLEALRELPDAPQVPTVSVQSIRTLFISVAVLQSDIERMNEEINALREKIEA